MKTLILTVMITLFSIGCGGSGATESNTTPPEPNIANESITPPSSPTLE